MSASVAPLGDPHASHLPYTNAHYFCNWCGRVVQIIYEGLKDVAHGITIGAKKTAEAFSNIFKDSSAFNRFARLGINLFSSVELAIGRPGAFSRITERLIITETVIDTFQVADNIGYFGAEKHKGDSIYNVLSNAAFLTAGTLGLFLFLGDLTILNLAKIGDALGKLPIFGLIQQSGVTLGTLVSGTVGIAFSFCAADAIKRIIESDNRADRTKAWLDLAWCTAEIAKSILFIACAANVVLLLVAGTVAAGLGISTYLYGLSVEEQKRKLLKT